MGLWDSIGKGVGLLNSTADNLSTSPLFGLAMGLLNDRGLTPPGQAIQGGLAATQQAQAGKQQLAMNQQQMGMNQLQMQALQAQIPAQLQFYHYLGGLMGDKSVSPSQAAKKAQGLMSDTTPDADAADASASPTDTPSASDPFALMRTGAFGAAAGARGASELFDYGKTLAQYSPQLATQLESAKGALAQDQYEMRQAQSNNDALGFKAAQMKYLKDSGLVTQSSMNGAVQTFGGITPEMLQMSTYNPQQGVRTVNGVETPIPGAPQTEATLAGAKAGAESAAEYAPIYDSTGNQIGFAPRASIISRPPAPNPSAPAGATPATGASSGVNFGLGPQSKVMLTGNAEQALSTNKEFQEQAEAGNSMIAQVDDLLHGANDFTTGRFANTRGTILDYLNSAGLITPQQKKELAAKQAGDKISIQLQAAATKQLGSREAAQIFSQMGKSLPNFTLSQEGLGLVGGWQKGIARYQIARAADANTKAQSQDATSVNKVRDSWISNSNPLYYVVASLPASQRSSWIKSLKNPQTFVSDWNKAANSGYAPRPSDYDNQ